MKRFDFTQTGGFPLSQDRLKWLQDGYIDAINALGGSCGATSNCVISGVLLTSGSWYAGGTVSDGWIYSPQYGVVPFVGGNFNPAMSDISFQDTIPIPPNPLSFANNAAYNVQLLRVCKIQNGPSNNLQNLSQNRWATQLGFNARTAWTNGTLASGSTGSIKMMVDEMTGMVHVRGGITRGLNNITVQNSGFPYNVVATILAPTNFNITPADRIYFQTTMPTPVQDLTGKWQITGNGYIDENPVIISIGPGQSSISLKINLVGFQPAGLGSTTNTQYFDFSYKI